jgi:hypothetical protein
MPLPFQIVLRDDVVIATVNLDNQHLLRARKVHDPRLNRILAGTGTLKNSTFRTNKARGAGGGWGEGIVRPRSAQCVLKLWRHFGDEMLPSEGSEACRGVSTVAGRDRVESPHTARAHLRFWLASNSQVGMEAPTIGALAIEHVGRARSQG